MTSHQPSANQLRLLGNFSSTPSAVPQAFVILTGKASEHTLEVDGIEGTERGARKEVKDLKAMGFDDARFKPFATWAEAEAYEDKVRGY